MSRSEPPIGGDLEEAISSDIRADRRLLLPGPYPPLSHLGATLLRHAVHAALRYALYQLGQALPESPPTRFVALRLYLDGPALAEVLGPRTDSREVLGALLDPGGTAIAPLPMRLRGMMWFHRRRLVARAAPLGRLLSRVPVRRAEPAARERRAGEFQALLSRRLPALGEALLGELIAALDRRRARAAGHDLGPVQSREAKRLLDGSRPDLARLGLPDPRVPSWLARMPNIPAEAHPAVLSACPEHRLRGGFRERYRLLLDELRPGLLEAGSRAVAKGHLDSVDDLFFLPLDLIGDVEAAEKPAWLPAAIESNRAEWLELRQRNVPGDTFGNVEPESRLDLPGDLAPLCPLR